MEQVVPVAAGAGLIGKTHIKLARKTRNVSWRRLLILLRAKEVAEEYGVKVYASLKTLFAHNVLVWSWRQRKRLHAIQAHECINAGVPAIVEKPVTDSIEDARWLLKHANRESKNAGWPPPCL